MGFGTYETGESTSSGSSSSSRQMGRPHIHIIDNGFVGKMLVTRQIKSESRRMYSFLSQHTATATNALYEA